MVCIKFDQKIKNLKNLNFDFSGFLGFFKNLKNLGFFRSHFPALLFTVQCIVKPQNTAIG